MAERHHHHGRQHAGAAGKPVAAQLPLAFEMTGLRRDQLRRPAATSQAGNASARRRRSASRPIAASAKAANGTGLMMADLRAEESEQAEDVGEAMIPVRILARVLEGRELMLGVPPQRFGAISRRATASAAQVPGCLSVARARGDTAA